MALRRQVCFALYAASRATTALYRPLLDELGLTYPQYLVLLVLWERDGRTVKELGEELRLDSGTLSPLLKRMEAAGLVARHRTAGDERVVEVRLTAAGTELQARARSVPATLVAATGLDRKTLVELRDTLTTLASTMDIAAAELAAKKK
ncbi:MarR family winged helix-turn-helix transcriptional regulator [Phytohabitans aurantiacus]|uniref:Transcriptional regulator, MarR family protein n=1 Tax=Phytohabitans aurantiacus TaxID=3016789 RepID=A0ABQ5R936_9ACTN|nr:MarR family transcriptional regulator [Phytohabitans aurantiacus]GLI02397.1 putative transcriptional regulator, MarR family protein [Phytohabitans aurantiacus]